MGARRGAREYSNTVADDQKAKSKMVAVMHEDGLAPYEELLKIADELDRVAEVARTSGLHAQARTLLKAAQAVDCAASGSWHGYHAFVYYEDLQPPPPGAHFSMEWGLKHTVGTLGSRGQWREFDAEQIRAHIYTLAGNPDLSGAEKYISDASSATESNKSEIVSILTAIEQEISDGYLLDLMKKVNDFQFISKEKILERARPKGQFVTRDSVVIGQGT